MVDNNATLIRKSRFCRICGGGCTWQEVNGQIIEGKITVQVYPSPTENDPHRELHICDSCKSVFKSIAEEVLIEKGIIKKK